MTPRQVLPVAIGLALLSVFAVGFRSAPAGPTKGWMTDLAKAKAEAKKTGKVLMVDFNATWCGPCQLYKKDVFTTAAFKNATKNVILVDIDTDEQPALAQKFQVGPIPDIRFISPSGKQVGKVVGYGGPEPLLKELEKAKKAK